MICDSNFEITNTVDEDITVTSGSKLILFGIMNGMLHLNDGSSCDIKGTHNGKIIVDADCSLVIYGVFSGTIQNHGSVTIHGIADIKQKSGNAIAICKDAIVNGVTYSADSSL